MMTEEILEIPENRNELMYIQNGTFKSLCFN